MVINSRNSTSGIFHKQSISNDIDVWAREGLWGGAIIKSHQLPSISEYTSRDKVISSSENLIDF